MFDISVNTSKSLDISSGGLAQDCCNSNFDVVEYVIRTPSDYFTHILIFDHLIDLNCERLHELVSFLIHTLGLLATYVIVECNNRMCVCVCVCVVCVCVGGGYKLFLTTLKMACIIGTVPIERPSL